MYNIDDNDKKDFEELKLKIYNEVKSFIESHPNVESYIKRYIELYSSIFFCNPVFKLEINNLDDINEANMTASIKCGTSILE